MYIICPQCGTNYAATDDALGQAGRHVKCRKCRYVWFVSPYNMEQQDERIFSHDTLTDLEPNSLSTNDFDWKNYEENNENSSMKKENILQPQNTETWKLQENIIRNAWEKTVKSRLPSPFHHRFHNPWIIAGSVGIMLLVLGYGLFLARVSVVRLLPGTARLYAAIGYPVNLRGLEFHQTKYKWMVENGLPVLVIQGTVSNITDSLQAVPPLRLALFNEDGVEIYRWTAKVKKQKLRPNEQIKFSTKLITPPKAVNLQIRFTDHDKK
ncbi:MAG: zinc-ribbon domain-containing protein [Alphaproteobacteria bacterium]|nr:zinc-ribbon domain-containing protein [Alphaproteobacteria bacterium]